MSNVIALLENGMDVIKHYPYISFSFLTLILLSRLRRRSSGPKLRGPPSTSRLWGVSSELFKSMDGSLYEAWCKVYGPVYQIPVALGASLVVVLDPKALGALFARDTSIYHQPGLNKTLLRKNVSERIIHTPSGRITNVHCPSSGKC
jgi:hypothetical protein